jgi:hypothetical protein
VQSFFLERAWAASSSIAAWADVSATSEKAAAPSKALREVSFMVVVTPVLKNSFDLDDMVILRPQSTVRNARTNSPIDVYQTIDIRYWLPSPLPTQPQGAG